MSYVHHCEHCLTTICHACPFRPRTRCLHLIRSDSLTSDLTKSVRPHLTRSDNLTSDLRNRLFGRQRGDDHGQLMTGAELFWENIDTSQQYFYQNKPTTMKQPAVFSLEKKTSTSKTYALTCTDLFFKKITVRLNMRSECSTLANRNGGSRQRNTNKYTRTKAPILLIQLKRAENEIETEYQYN